MNINPQYHKTKEQIYSEQQLVEYAKANSKDFKPLYNQYYEIVFRFVFQRTGNENLTSEVVSNVFFKVLRIINQQLLILKKKQ